MLTSSASPCAAVQTVRVVTWGGRKPPPANCSTFTRTSGCRVATCMAETRTLRAVRGWW
eukprot:SAG31_NODE_44939_length_248_cov_1.614907_1_plen_58_part_01